MELFNFSNYDKNLSKKSEINIDFSGIPVGSDGIITTKDDSGNITESKVTEKVDEKQNFVFTGKVICNQYPELSQKVGEPLYRYHVTESNTSVTYKAREIVYYAGERVVTEVQNIVFNADNKPAILTLNGFHPDNQSIPVIYQIDIVPRHLLMYDLNYNFTATIKSITVKTININKFKSYSVYEIVTNTKHNLPNWKNSAVKVDYYNIYERQSYVQYLITINNSDLIELNKENEISSVIDDYTFRIINTKDKNQTLQNVGIVSNCRYRSYRITTREPILDRSVYAGLGLWDTNDYDIGFESGLNPNHIYGKDLNISDTNASGYIKKKDFDNYVKILSTKLSDNGIEILINKYLPKIVNDIDVNNTYIPRYKNNQSIFGSDNTTFNVSKLQGLSYIKSYLPELTSTQLGVGNISVKECFRAQFETAQSLNNRLLSYISSIVTTLNSLPIPDEFVDEIFNSKFKASFIVVEATPTEYIAKSVDGELTFPIQYTTDKYQAYDITRGKSNDGKYITRKTIEISAKTTIKKVIDQAKNAVDHYTFAQVAMLVLVSSSIGILMQSSGSELRTLKDNIEEVERKIKWFEKFTNESVFSNKEYLGNYIRNGKSYNNPMPYNLFSYDKKMAHVLIPVDVGTIKRKVTDKNNKVKTVKEDAGIRWYEVGFVDSSTLDNHRVSDEINGKLIPLDKVILQTAVSRPSTLTENKFSVDLNINIPNHGIPVTTNNFTISIENYNDSHYNGNFPALRLDSNNIRVCVIDEIAKVATKVNGETIYIDKVIPPVITNPVNGKVISAIVPLEPTQPTDKNTQVNIEYSIPYLPNNTQLITKIFQLYGSFDQSKFATRSRSGDINSNTGKLRVGDDYANEGFQIFPTSSKDLKNMRTGVDVYNKVAFLMKLLINEFGESRVKLIETSRSVADQEKMQLGGPSSVFLSWHNFGLGARIIIKDSNLIDNIEEGSNDFFRFFDIAETFMEGCYNGNFGNPCNAVWCGQLVTNPDIFAWEFLPIGTNHKDSWKYRDSALNQRDPIKDYSFVNINGMIIGAKDPVSTNVPFIRNNSSAYTNAITINGNKYVSPKDIKNYPLPKNIILKDVQEFMYLVKVKMDANGTNLTGDKNVRKWKIRNPNSYLQLIYYYGLTGNTANASGLISGEYIDQYETFIITTFKNDPIKFVQEYLGIERYNSIKVSIDSSSDGSFISLKTGKMTTPVLETRSIMPEGNGNTFLEKQSNQEHIEYGQYQNGVFIPKGDSRIISSTTLTPVISGYEYSIATSEYYAVSDDAKLLHYIIAQQIFDEFNNIKSNFESLNIKFMYDEFTSSANYGRTRTLENEYGIIESQDIITMSQLRAMYNRLITKVANDGTVLGIGVNIEAQEGKDRNIEQSVYEKLISNAQLSGARKAKLTKENIIIEDLKNDVTVEKVVKFIQNIKDPDSKTIR